jgi:peptidoglycan hydrolase-like protein with peptidoglycan-binding domain
MLRPGESGPAILALQQRLVELGYWLGTPDSGYGDLTRQAVMAFQKAEGLGRDGIAGPETQGRLATAGRPMGRSTSGNLIEIDLARQLILVIQNGQVQWAFNTSTGTSATPTPRGQYTIQRQIDGYRRSELGLLYRPKYFVGGVAIHGSASVPPYPASHACTRLSNPAMDWMWSSGVAQIGTMVWTY